MLRRSRCVDGLDYLIDSKGALFRIELGCEPVDEFVDPMSGAKLDVETGEVLG